MSVPADAVAGAVFTIARSEIGRASGRERGEISVVAVSLKKMVAVTGGGLEMGPVAAGLMCTTMVKGWVALAASVPKLQVTVPVVFVAPALAGTEVVCAGRTWAPVPPLEVEGPLLVTVRE